MNMNKKINIVSVTALIAGLLYGCTNSNSNSKYINKTVANKIKQATEYYENKDFKKSINILKTLAKQGNASAQYRLGYIYYYGHGVKSNKKIAAHWIRQSSSQGYDKALQANKMIGLTVPATQVAAKAPSTKLPETQVATKTPSTNIAKEEILEKKHRQVLQKIKKLRKTLTLEKKHQHALHELKNLQKKIVSSNLEKKHQEKLQELKNLQKKLAENSKYLKKYEAPVISASKMLTPRQQRSAKTTTNHQSHYGPIHNHETLWSIAKKTRPNTNISIHNMMQALYKKKSHGL